MTPEPRTPLDGERFLRAYLKHSGEGYGRVPPETLESLFDGLHDPDDFYSKTASTLQAACSSVARRDTALQTDPCLSRVTVFPGNVRVETNFTFDSHVLVLGDLDVERVVTASPAHAILMVAGSVRCCAMQLVRGYLFVAGNVIARECFLGCLYGLSKVAGRIETGVYLHDSSWANLPIDARLDEDTTTDNIEAGISIDIDAPNARATLASMVVPSALGDEKPDFGEGHVDLYALFDHIAAGVAAFRE